MASCSLPAIAPGGETHPTQRAPASQRREAPQDHACKRRRPGDEHHQRRTPIWLRAAAVVVGGAIVLTLLWLVMPHSPIGVAIDAILTLVVVFGGVFWALSGRDTDTSEPGPADAGVHVQRATGPRRPPHDRASDPTPGKVRVVANG